MVTSPRNRYRTRYKVSAEKPRSSELRLSPTRANCNNQADFLSLFGLKKALPQPTETTLDTYHLRLCSVVVMCSRCDICKRWFKSATDAETHISQSHDDFEVAFVQRSLLKRRNKARRGRSMNKENRTVRRTRQKPIENFSLGQFGELSETADLSPYKELPKTVVKKVRKPAMPKPRIIKRPLLLPPTLLQGRTALPMVENDSDDDIQFCYEVKYNHEQTVQSDDDCAVVCEVVKKEKPATITPDPAAPRCFQDPRITSSDGFFIPKKLVDPSQLCETRYDQTNEKVVPFRTNKTEVSSTSRSNFPAFHFNGRVQPVKKCNRNLEWARQIDAHVKLYKQTAVLQHESLDDISYDKYMNAGRSDDKKQECDSTDEVIII